MTKKQYLDFHKKFCADMIEITAKKNADYTGTDPDPFANFSKVQVLCICSTEQGFLTRMTDKFCRITSFVQKGELLVKDESVQDTLHDLANYCALMSGYIESKKGTFKRFSESLPGSLRNGKKSYEVDDRINLNGSWGTIVPNTKLPGDICVKWDNVTQVSSYGKDFLDSHALCSR